jgi:signal transduction histidine kinase
VALAPGNRNWTPHPPRTLRSRMALSHAAVLLLALLVVLLVIAGILARESRRIQVEELRSVAVPLLVQANFVDRSPGVALPSGASFEAAFDQQAETMGIRVLLLAADGTVRLDTGDAANLASQRLVAYITPMSELQAVVVPGDGILTREAIPDAAHPNPLAGYRVVMAVDAGPPDTTIVVAAPVSRPDLIGRLAAGTGLALAVALAVAALAGWLMSRAISAPISALASAADAMSRGDLDQQVQGEGEDEIGSLIARFNAMSRTVASIDRSQRALLADVAHELRTPLTSVRGYAQALRTGVAADEASRQRALAMIETESARMSRLVTELLDLSRLESGQASLAVEPLDLGEALQRTVDRFAPTAAERGVHLEAVSAGPVWIAGDDDRIAQALGNLVDNALRHTAPGGTVRLETRAGRSAIEVRVADNGSGMDAATTSRAFDRFRRGPGVPGSGFGLGLPIVKEIIASHGGSVRIESEPGVGTTVTLAFPAPSRPEPMRKGTP